MAENEAASRAADNRTFVLYCIIGTLVPTTAVIVAMRFYARKVLAKALGADDWVCLVSLCIIIAMSTTMCLMTRTGLGYHLDTLTNDQLLEYNRLFYIDIAFYIAVLGTIKLQILLQYFRLFAVRMRKVTIWVTVIVCIWSLGSWLGCIFRCNPIPGWWDPSIQSVCIPALPQWYFNAAGNIATDLIIFALPIPVLWKLNLPLHERVYLMAIFGLGFFTCCISMVRITALSQPADDITYSNIDASGWSVGETCLGTIVSCLPTLRPFLAPLTRPFLRYNPGISAEQNPPSRTMRTFGGGYIDHSGKRHGASSGMNGASSGSKNKSATAHTRTGSSTEELTRDGDVEMAIIIQGAREATTPTEKAMAQWESASETALNESAATTLPIQRRSGPPRKGSRDYAQDREARSRLSQTDKDELLGLRQATQTTIQAGEEHEGGVGGGLSPRPASGARSPTGIQVKRVVRQDSGPRYSHDPE